MREISVVNLCRAKLSTIGLFFLMSVVAMGVIAVDRSFAIGTGDGNLLKRSQEETCHACHKTEENAIADLNSIKYHSSDWAGTCSNTNYTNKAACIGGGGSWTPNKWGASGWGITGGHYGKFICTTCHTAHSTANIYLMKETITAPDSSNWGSTGTGTVGPVFKKKTKAASPNPGVSDGNMGDDSDNHTTSTRVCEVCHSLTTHHRYDTTAQTDGKNHENGNDCTSCHSHKVGFKASCDFCHGNPPLPLAGLNGSTPTGSTTAGAHTFHATATGSGMNYPCSDCHAGSVGTGSFHNDTKITMGFVNIFGSATGGGYTGQTGVAYESSDSGTTVSNPGTGTKTCSSIYCHGSTIGGPLTAPVWDAAAGAYSCASLANGACHGGSASTPPSRVNHPKHAGSTGYGYACDLCHSTTGNAPTGAHVNGSVAWGFKAADARTSGALYNGLNSGATGTLAPSSSYSTCTSLYCHSDGQKSAAYNAPLITPTWGGSLDLTCTGCHRGDNNATNKMASGSHTKHVQNNTIDCVRCHSATVSNSRTISTQANHVNKLINVSLDAVANPLSNATYAGSASPMSKAPDNGASYGACTSISCHNDGTGIWSGTTGVGNTPTWGATGGCNSCHGNSTYADYRKGFPLYTSGSPKPNAHDRHTDARTTPSNEPQCKMCHASVTASNTAIDGTTPANHANNVYNVVQGSTYYDGDAVGGGYTVPVTTTYSYAASPSTSTCSNVTCHPTGTAGSKGASSTRWDTGYNCTDCHNINLTNTSGYHHAMNNAASGYPTTVPQGDASSGTNPASRKCTMCHVDHSIFSPMLNTSNATGRSMNLRTDIGTTPNASSGYTNSDYATGGGICISCHTTQLTKSGSAVKAETNSTTALAVTDANYSTSSHQYNVTSTLTNGSSTFNANCSKCHDAQNNDGQTFQSSTNKFGTHDGTLRRLLASLGITSPADPEEEDFCYRCHSKNTDTTPGGGPAKGTAGRDYYGASGATMTAAAEDIYTAMQLGSAGSAQVTTNAGTLYMRDTSFAPAYGSATPKPAAYLLTSGTYTGSATFTQRYIDVASGTTQETRAQTSGGTANRYIRYIQFVSPPLASSWTVNSGSNFTVNIRRGVSAAAAVRTRIQVYRYTSGGASTALNSAVLQDGTNWPTTAGNQAITFTTNVAATFNAGDSLVVEIEAIQTNTTSATATFYWGQFSTDGASIGLPSTATFVTTPGTSSSGRHNVAAYSGLHKPSPTDETLAYISANKHVECDDCHDPHAAKSGNHTQGTNAVANVLLGVSGATPTSWGSYGTTASSTLYLRNNATTNTVSPVDPVAYQYSSGTYTTSTFNLRDMAPTSGATAANTAINTGTTAARYDRGLQFVSPQIDNAVTIPSGSTFTLTIREVRAAGTSTDYTRFTVYKWNGTTATPFNTSAAPANFAQNATAITTTATNRSLAFTTNQAVTLNPGDAIVCDVEYYHSAGTTNIAVTYTYGNFGTDAAALALPAGTYNWRTSPPGNWTAPASFTLQTSTYEYEICFKCHSSANTNVTSWGGSGAAAWTDVALEFNPNNRAMHPVVMSLNSAPGPLTPKPLVNTTMVAPWTTVGTQVMTCSDCHATSSTASKGPHGSAVKWMLAGTNKAWPFTGAANNGASTGTTFKAGNYNTGAGTADGLFCLNCHAVYNTNIFHKDWGLGTGGNQHTNPNAGGIPYSACVSCHIRVPHGGKVSRLLAAATTRTNLPARYWPDGNGGDVAGQSNWTFSSITKNTAGNWATNPSTFSSGGCGTHGGSGSETW